MPSVPHTLCPQLTVTGPFMPVPEQEQLDVHDCPVGEKPLALHE